MHVCTMTRTRFNVQWMRQRWKHVSANTINTNTSLRLKTCAGAAAAAPSACTLPTSVLMNSSYRPSASQNTSRGHANTKGQDRQHRWHTSSRGHGVSSGQPGKRRRDAVDDRYRGRRHSPHNERVYKNRRRHYNNDRRRSADRHPCRSDTSPDDARGQMMLTPWRDYGYYAHNVLGKGQQATVYRAFRLHNGMPAQDTGHVALKVFKPRAADAGTVESQALELVQAEPHDNIVKCLDCQMGHDKRVYVTMPLAEGGSVADLVSRAAGGRLAEEEARPLFRQLLAALLHCHQHGVAHMDVKPAVRYLTF